MRKKSLSCTLETRHFRQYPIRAMGAVLKTLIIAICVTLLTGCDIIAPCDDSGRAAAVRALPIDSITGDTIYDERIVGVLREGAEVDTTRVGAESPPPAMAFLWGRPGTYTLEIRAPGYKLWRRDRIVVEDDRCRGARTRVILALLQRE